MRDEAVPAAVLRALHFAADRHRDQRRKGAEAAPYVNHLIEVAELLARVGRIEDPVLLQAAALHDTLEDTETTSGDLEREFGPAVRALVEEVTDDRRLPKAERKRLQVVHAPGLSEGAKLLKLADKISNVRAMTHTPPSTWPLERRREYLDWTEQVVAGCRGCSGPLERLYDEALAEGRRLIGSARP